MALFETIIEALALKSRLVAARAKFNDDLADTIEKLGINGLMDDGSVLTTSMQEPGKFMLVTDALFDSLDADHPARAILKDVEQVAAERFVPNLEVKPSAVDGHVDVVCKDVGLALGLWGSEHTSFEQINADTDMEEIYEHEAYKYLGRLTVASDSSVHWSPENTPPVAKQTVGDVMIPAHENADSKVRVTE